MPRLISDIAISLTMSVRASFKMLHVVKSYILEKLLFRLIYVTNEARHGNRDPSLTFTQHPVHSVTVHTARVETRKASNGPFADRSTFVLSSVALKINTSVV